MTDVKNFWNNVNRSNSICPNPCFFRFLAHLNIDLKDKDVLELGCGACSDLLEIQKRGARTYGIDIDRRKIDENNNQGHQLLLGNILTEINKFNKEFDLIFSQDTLYYLDECELSLCLQEVKKHLKKDGKFVIQVISGDYRIINGGEVWDKKAIFKDDNPAILKDKNFYFSIIKKNGFAIDGVKMVKETFFIKCEEIRHNLYLCCSRREIN